MQIKQRLMPTLPVECWELGEGRVDIRGGLESRSRVGGCCTYVPVFLAFPRPGLPLPLSCRQSGRAGDSSLSTEYGYVHRRPPRGGNSDVKGPSCETVVRYL